MKAVGLFAGIGGIEYGLHQNGIDTVSLCEIMPEAQCVLKKNFPGASLFSDVTLMDALPEADILSGGFPCQDISIAGTKAGLKGSRSSLVYEIFRLLKSGKRPSFLIIENVANIISLNNGEALSVITQELSSLGYEWAYRLVDSRSFGIPQRRPRFVLVASNIMHPKHLMYPTDENVNATILEKVITEDTLQESYGFYWTEGKIGIGWANNSIPPLKCGSTIGLPSSPAVWDVNRCFFGTPTIHDAERLQAFIPGWTAPVTTSGFRDSLRWKLVGNAVNTAVSQWIGSLIVSGCHYEIRENLTHEKKTKKWTKSAFSDKGKVIEIETSPYPLGINYKPILDYLSEPLKPLSLKATLGFYKRVNESTLIRYPDCFKDAIEKYLKEQYDYDYKDSRDI